MAVLSTKIPQFVNRAVTKCRIMATDLLEEFDPQGYQSESAADLQLKLYETRQFLKLLTGTEDYGGMTAKEISDNIDFFTSWLQLNKITAVNYLHYTMPIQGPVTVQSGVYALQADLTSEIQARTSADSALSNRVTALENAYFSPDSVFPDNFWDNYEADYSVVFDDDQRLHTHSNKNDLDNITGPMVTALSGLQAHYESINGSNSVHITTAERNSWNARITSSQLSSALTGYSQTSHTHTINQVTGLEDVINGINQDILDMAAEPGEDGREVEFQRNGDNLEWRYVGDAIWIDLGVVKGDEGPEFSIEVRGLSNDRFNSLYDNEGTDFSYLETDTGYLYFREPGGGLATVPGGWSTGIKFTGDNGWSPILGVYEYTASRVVQEIVDWTGGVGTKPVFDAGSSPPNPIRWFVGPNGPTLDPNQAVNIKGPMGNGHGPIIGAVGAIAGRTAYDGTSIGFIYMRNDVSPQTIFVKNSDASADWSAELPWQGPAGLEGAAANSITNAMLRQSAALSVIGRSANSVGDVADIAGTAGQLLRVSGTTLGFGNDGLNALVFNNNQGIDVVASGGSDVLNIGTSNADVINIGWSGSVVNITGSLNYQNVTNLEVTDKLIRLNKGGAAASAVSSGFELEENSVVTGYFATNATRDGWDFKSPAIAGVATFSQASLTGARTYTLPDASGTFVLTSRSVATQHSLTGGGDFSADRTINLVGDVASPGNNMLYGTNGSGTRGWYAISGGGLGDVVGPASSTDNAIVRFDTTTGKLVQNSAVTITDSGDFTIGTDAGTLRIFNAGSSGANAGLRLVAKGTAASSSIQLAAGSTALVLEGDVSRATFGSFSNVIIRGASNTGFGPYHLTVRGGDGFSGNESGGDLYLDGGVPSGSGVRGNIGLFTTSVADWKSSQRIIFIGNRSADPSAAIADGIALYSKDSSDGSANSTLALFTEQAPEATTTFTQTHRIKVWWNNVEYWMSLDAV